jgi:hypothetical protein
LPSRDKGDPVIIETNRGQNIEQLSKRLDMLDERLDNIDSIVTSLVERVMEKPLVMEISCPKCGQPIEINITSSIRVRGKD